MGFAIFDLRFSSVIERKHCMVRTLPQSDQL